MSAAAPPSDPPPPRSIHDEDESVRIAIRALGDMRAGAGAGASGPVPQSPASLAPSTSSFQPTPALSVASTSTSPTLGSPALLGADADPNPDADAEEPDFVARVATLPVVSTALRAYEQSKASSRVVKYGAEMMESSVKSISRPVIDRLPVTSLDEFACRQLDRLGRYGGRRPSSADDDERSASVERGGWETGLQMRDVSMARGSLERESEFSPERQELLGSVSTEEQQRQVVQRSRWQAVLLEAGGIGAAVSEESMRRLKYCLQWLQFATTHIDGQILILRDFIASLQPPPGSQHALNPDALISPEHMRQLTNVKRDVVATVRQVVDVVSKYAGGALPEPARTRVRGFILHLPQAWASAARRENVPPAQARGRGASRRSARRPGETSRPASPTRHSRQSSSAGTVAVAAGAGAVPPTAGSATQAAQRILALATESLDMMRGVTGVVKDSLDRADAWVERLRIVGLQRGGADVDVDVAAGAAPLNMMAHRAPAGESAATSAAGSPASVHAALPALSPLLYSAASVSVSATAPASPQDTYFADHHTAGIGRLSLGGGGGAPPTPNKKDLFAEGGERSGTPRAAWPAMEVDDE